MTDPKQPKPATDDTQPAAPKKPQLTERELDGIAGGTGPQGPIGPDGPLGPDDPYTPGVV